MHSEAPEVIERLSTTSSFAPNGIYILMQLAIVRARTNGTTGSYTRACRNFAKSFAYNFLGIGTTMDIEHRMEPLNKKTREPLNDWTQKALNQ